MTTQINQSPFELPQTGYSQFDKVLPRLGTNCLKWDFMDKWLGVDATTTLPSWVSDSDFACPPFITEALQQRLAHPSFGYSERDDAYYNSVIEWYRSNHNVELKPEWFYTTPGTLPAIAALIEEITNPGDQVAVFGPVYTAFYRSIERTHRQPFTIPLSENNGYYSIDFDLFETALVQGVKAVVFCNPHNPVGRCWTKEEVYRVAELCHQYGVYLISDEIWADTTLFGHRYTSALTLPEAFRERMAVCISGTKTFNLPSFRLCNTIIPNPALAAIMENKLLAYGIDVYSALSLVANTAGYQHGGEWVAEMNKYLEGNLLLAHDFIQSELPQFKFRLPESTYLAWVDCRELAISDEALKRRFCHGAKVVPSMGEAFGEQGKGFVRLNLSCARSVVEEKLVRIKKEFG